MNTPPFLTVRAAFHQTLPIPVMQNVQTPLPRGSDALREPLPCRLSRNSEGRSNLCPTNLPRPEKLDYPLKLTTLSLQRILNGSKSLQQALCRKFFVRGCLKGRCRVPRNDVITKRYTLVTDKDARWTGYQRFYVMLRLKAERTVEGWR